MKPKVIHHVSQFQRFNGTIQLDRESNRYLNLTFEVCFWGFKGVTMYKFSPKMFFLSKNVIIK